MLSNMQQISRIHAFTLFEVFIAWSLFTLTMTGVAYAQASALKNLRNAYSRDVAVIQFSNLRELFRATHDPVVREQAYALWHKQNQQLLIHETDHYICYATSCCVNLQGTTYSLNSCFSTSTN